MQLIFVYLVCIAAVYSGRAAALSWLFLLTVEYLPEDVHIVDLMENSSLPLYG